MALYCYAAINFIFCVYLLFFVQEPTAARTEHSIKRLFTHVLPALIKKRRIIQLIIFIFGTRGWLAALGEPLTLKFMEHGMDKVELSNLDTIVLPLSIAYYCLSNKVLKPKRFLQTFYWITIIKALMTLLRYFVLQELISSGDTTSCFYHLLLINIVYTIGDVQIVFFFAYCAAILDPKIGATMVTFLMVFWNFGSQIPESIGLKIVGHVDFRYYAWTCFVFFTITILIMYFFAINLDHVDLRE